MGFTQGNSWELAVAVPIRNPFFEEGKYGEALLNTVVNPNSLELGFNKTLLDGPKLDSFLQTGDEITLGPSSNITNIRELESLIVSGINQSTGKIILRDRDGKLYFGATDHISFKGSGIASGWEVGEQNVKAEGIKNGPVSRQYIRSFTQGTGPGTYALTNVNGLNQITFTRHTADYGFGLDWLNSNMDKIITPLYIDTLPKMKFASTTSNISGTQYVLLGDYHRGGWRKASAQRIRITLDGTTPDQTILSQALVDYGDTTSNIRRKASVTPYQFYRIGGKVFLDPLISTSIYDTDYNLSMVLHPGSVNDWTTNEAFSVDILDANNENVQKWYEFQKVGLFESGISNSQFPHLGLWLDNKTLTAKGDVALYMDEVWLEHAGGVNFADLDGCLKFERYGVWPEQGSIEITEKEVESKTSKRKLKIIKCQLDYVNQNFWDNLQYLLEWQNRGYYLNLHSYIIDLGHVMTGTLKIRNWTKNSWDLSLRSFQLEFEEMI